MKHAKGRPVAKRLVAAATALAAVAALAAGGTLAYFAASERAHNVVTSGGVGIELNEWADEAKTVPFEDVEGVMPGDEVVKVVEVENTGQASAWVRVKAEVDVEAAEGSEAPAELSAGVVSMDWNMVMWTEGEGGWWYYNAPLLPGEATYPLFSHVAFAGDEMGDPYQGCAVTVDVSAQAVQTANNGESALSADGWPEE